MTDVLRAQISRRLLLKAGLATVCGCLAPWPLLAQGNPPASPSAASPFPQKQLLAEFQGVCQGVEAYLAASASQALGQAIAADALARFKRQLPGMPWVGGDANINQTYIIKAGWLIAITAAMRERGFAPADAGRLFYELNLRDTREADAAQLRAHGDAFFAPANRAELLRWAAWTQKRTYPGDWVAQVSLGDGKDDDIAVDYLECGALKYFRSQGQAAVAPYFCLSDFVRSRAEGTGLVRGGTLAQGMKRCDFRYKQGREVTQDWSTEVPRFPAT